MNLDAIQTFVDVVTHGSFAAVARTRRVAPSSVSRVIAELEAELEVRLFQRTTRRLSLTETGQAYLDRVAPLLEELEQARDHARDLSSAPRGLLRIAVAGTFAQLHLARWLPRFMALHDQLRVELVLDVRYTDLISEQIDVAIRLGPSQPTSAVARKLCAMPRVVVASLLIRDEYGCEVRQRINVERRKCPFYLPNIISGHSSSVNNNFIIKTLDDYNLNVIKYRIYDRWGNLVYISGGFSVHENGHWWNGYFNDKEAVNGVYCYLIEVQHPNGDVEDL